MPEETPLYEDSAIRITPMPRNPQEHFIYFHNCRDEETHPLMQKPRVSRYLIPRGCLKEFATTSRDGLLRKLKNLNEDMVHDALSRGLSSEALGLAMTQAYNEEERCYRDSVHI